MCVFWSLFLAIEGLGRMELFELARKAVDYIYAGKGVKMELIKVFESVGRTLEYN